MGVEDCFNVNMSHNPQRGYRVSYEVLKSWWFNTGKSGDILTVNAKILDEKARERFMERLKIQE